MAGRFRGQWPVRLAAALTLGYSSAMTARPAMLARPVDLLAPDGSVPPGVTALTRSMGTRDAAMALALLVAPAGSAMRVLTAARVLCDGADAAYFGAIVPPRQRVKVVAFCGGWALVEVLAQVAVDRRRVPRRPTG